MKNARELVLKGLYQIEYKGTYTSEALEQLLAADLGPADRAFAARLLTETVENKLKLDHIIRQFSSLKLKKLSPWVLLILRTGVCQMVCMDKIPDSAACSEAVKLAKRYAHGAAAGYVNGVLRTVARERENIAYPEAPLERLSVVWSCPLWLTQKLAEQYGTETCARILEESHRRHPPTLRANCLRTTGPELSEVLAREGIAARPLPERPWQLTVEGPLDVRRSAAYAQGLYTLQNPSSMAAVELLDPQPGEQVIDLCAAPGGKTTYMAERMEDRGRVLAFDIHPHKIPLVEAAARRLGLTCICCRQMDAAVYREELADAGDRVLADVPCSGIGVMDKKPDIKWRRKPEDIPELCGVQRRILGNAGRYVKPGGVLVYSTCTILKEENQMQIAAFLEDNPEFTLEKERLLFTHETGGSGFYMARLRRSGG